MFYPVRARTEERGAESGKSVSYLEKKSERLASSFEDTCPSQLKDVTVPMVVAVSSDMDLRSALYNFVEQAKELKAD